MRVCLSVHRARTAAIVAILIVMFQVFILLLLEFINVRKLVINNYLFITAHTDPRYCSGSLLP